jgi:hexosaminidase
MKKISVLVFLSLAGICLIRCTQVSFPSGDQLVVNWKVISNEYSDQPAVKAQFTIENKSNFNMNASNWAMFYNQSPRKIISCTGNVTIDRISGDWFKLAPAKGFKLKAGAKAEIVIEASGWWIRETDAPQGAYFVFYDKKGAEEAIVAVSGYTIDPFTTPEQINRYRNDAEPIPTAELRYQQNLKMKEVAQNMLPAIIPTPVSVKMGIGKVFFDKAPEVLYEKGLESEAGYIAVLVGNLAQSVVTPKEATAPKGNSIFLTIRPMKVNGVSNEAYKIVVKKDKSIVVTGNDAEGVFHGIQSLISLIPPTMFAGGEEAAEMNEIVVEDAPRFPYRGLHIDVARDFQSKETIEKMIDLMAFYKINYLMLYLSEDEGWRIEIKELPELTEVGSRRGHTTKNAVDMVHPSYGSGPVANAPGSYGSGYYTREDFKEILKYAKLRHVNVIPTINFPGHSRAAIRSMETRYQKFIKEGNEEKANEFRLIDPDDISKYSSAQGYDDNVVCVARESVYKFYETVVDDIIEMYAEAGAPLEFFQTGGDEVPNGAWTESPLCKKLMETLPEFKDPKNLQSYFLRRTVDMLAKKNLKTGGWEEVALIKNESGDLLPNPEFVGKNVYPWVWNNQGRWADLAYRLANAGFPIVMCDVSHFYFDFPYNKDPKEPGLYWGGFCDTRDTWQFAPYNSFITNMKTPMGNPLDPDKDFSGLEKLKPGAEKNIIGLQAQLWGETIKGPQMLEYYTLPKLIGFAETAWAKARPWEKETNAIKRKHQMDEGWNLFANALAQKELPRLSGLFGGFNYRIPLPGAITEEGVLKANIEYPGLKIRYTTDGSEPTIQSTVYTEPVKFSGEVRLRAFDAAGRSSRTVLVKM